MSLKGKYGEVCMTMIGLGIDKGLFPMTIRIARTENIDSWEDFKHILATELVRHPKYLISL